MALPLLYFLILLLICITPALFLFTGIPIEDFFSVNKSNEAHEFSASQAFNVVCCTLGIAISLFGCVFTAIEYKIKRQQLASVIFTVMLCIAALETFHLLVSIRLLKLEIPFEDAVYFSWFVNRLALFCLLIFSAVYFLYFKNYYEKAHAYWSNINIINFGLTAFAISLLVSLKSIPNFFRIKSVFFLPVEEFFIITLLAIWAMLILYWINTKRGAVFSNLLIFSVLPAVFVSFYLSFSVLPFDFYYNLSRLMITVAYTIPFIGISLKYYRSVARQHVLNIELDKEIQRREEAINKLEQSEAILKQAESISQIGSFEWNKDSGMQFISDELYRIHGLSHHHTHISFYKDLIHPEDLEKCEKAFAGAINHEKDIVIEYRVLRPDTTIRYLYANAKIITSEGGGIRGTIQDISELKAIQKDLERKVAELDRSNQDLEQFAYIASHDLQEPLRKIDAFGNLFQLNYSAILPAEGKDYIKRMQSASQRMQVLIEDLLNFSKAIRGDDSFTETDLKEELSKVIEQLEIVIEEKKAVINALVEHKVSAIPVLIRQLFQNILSNSLKFSKLNIAPVIEIKSEIIKGQQASELNLNPLKSYCYISIKDNGIGFDESYADKIFSPFQRLHTRNEYEGTGIGLAICKKIVEKHNGYIHVHSEPGVGSIFKIYFPVVIE